jgi:hypothetical protein
MPQTKDKVLPLGKPRATKYLEIIAKRDGKRRAAQVEKEARALAEKADARVVRFEFVAEAAGVTLEQMADELAEHGIRTSPSNVRHGTLNGDRRRNTKPKAPAKTKPAKAKAATTAGEDGPGNARKATASKASPTKASSSSSKRGDVKPDPKRKQTTGHGSTKRSASSRKPAGSRGRAAGSSLSKSDQMRRLRERQASTKS